MAFELKFPFLRNRVAISWCNRGHISPLCLEDYIAEAYKEDDSVQKPTVKTKKYPNEGQFTILQFITNIPIWETVSVRKCKQYVLWSKGKWAEREFSSN